QLFTSDWQFVENTPLREWFRRRVYPTDPRAYRWDAAVFLHFQPRQVLMRDDKLVLLAAYKDQVWPIEFAKEEGQWMIDWVYTAKEASSVQSQRVRAATTKGVTR